MHQCPGPLLFLARFFLTPGILLADLLPFWKNGVEHLITTAISLGLALALTSSRMRMYQPSLQMRPVGQARPLGLPFFDEIHEIALHGLRDLCVFRFPRITFIQVQGYHCVLNFRRVRSAEGRGDGWPSLLRLKRADRACQISGANARVQIPVTPV